MRCCGLSCGQIAPPVVALWCSAASRRRGYAHAVQPLGEVALIGRIKLAPARTFDLHFFSRDRAQTRAWPCARVDPGHGSAREKHIWRALGEEIGSDAARKKRRAPWRRRSRVGERARDEALAAQRVVARSAGGARARVGAKRGAGRTEEGEPAGATKWVVVVVVWCGSSAALVVTRGRRPDVG